MFYSYGPWTATYYTLKSNECVKFQFIPFSSYRDTNLQAKDLKCDTDAWVSTIALPFLRIVELKNKLTN
jgi:hypothetical protein